MTILKGDIKLVASTVMDDVDEGGGPPSSHVINDQNSNEIFNDISELDRAGGRVSLRKVFAHVRTTNTDRYLGANAIVAVPFEDTNVSATLFTTGDVFDTREQAQTRVEAYLNAGPEWAGYLFENHIQGQRSIQLFMRTTQPAPPIGRTLLLRQNEGTGTQFEQYVRITRVTVEERTFTYNGDQDYKANIVTLDISDALRYDFTGSASSRTFARVNGSAIVRDTVVADAATYYGVVALEDPVVIGDAKIKVDSIYTQLVPNSRTETALIDQRPASDALVVIATAPRQVEVTQASLSQRIRIGQENRGFSYVTILNPRPAPGSVRVMFRALGNTYYIADNGDGTMGGADASGTGTVNYTTGSVSITLNALPDDRSAVVFYWGEKQSYTNRSGQAGFRAPEYNFDLEKTGIVASTFELGYTSGGVLKTVTSNSAGVLSGDGTGKLQATTGVVYFKPSFMPDPSSTFAIEYQWVDILEEVKPGISPDGAGVVTFTLAETPVLESIEVQWITERQASLSSGVSSAEGASAKTTNSSTNVSVVDVTKTYPSRGSWTYPPAVVDAFNKPAEEVSIRQTFNDPSNPFYGGSVWSLTTREPAITTSNSSGTNNSSYDRTSTQTSKSGVAVFHRAICGSDGNFFGTMGTASALAKSVTIKVTGDWEENSYQSNYETASAWESLNQTGTSGGGGPAPSAAQGGGGSSTSKGGSFGSTSQKEVFGTNSLMVRYRTGSGVPTSHSETFEPPAVVIDLTPYTKDQIVPGSLRFTWMGVTYEDFEGVLYRGRTPSDPGIACGGVMYSGGLCTVHDYVVSGSPTNFTLDSCYTTSCRTKVANVTFNTQLAPLKPSALVINVVDVDGGNITATSDIDGLIEATHVRGKVDYETGLVEIQFGDYVLDSGLTAEQKAEWWYDAANIRPGDGKIWRPWPIDPNTLRYNFVSYFYLPLDADILGLDPVRLPQDGRVPIFRPGAFAVLGHTGTVGPATVSNGQTVNCGRTRLSRVRVIGNDGNIIDTGYTEDLDLGTVTFTNVSGYSQPVTVEHRIEDMAMVSDVQINGFVSFTRQITHNYPVPGSYLSSALVAGDVRSRVQLTFDQATWNNVWSDSVNGSGPATGTFNTALHPITVNNLGALTERWAVVFTNSTTFNVIGEHTGVIATGNTSTDCSPLNPATGTPYFTIPFLGWGLGWATGNVLRFNTIGAQVPLWIARTVLQGPETVVDDSFQIIVRGDVDRP